MNSPHLSSNTFRLDGKVAIVTGGGSGIGRAIATIFAAHGASMRILDRNRNDAEGTCQLISQADGRASAYECDVTSQQQVRSTLDMMFSKERVHILVNNAGISHIELRRALRKKTSSASFE